MANSLDLRHAADLGVALDDEHRPPTIDDTARSEADHVVREMRWNRSLPWLVISIIALTVAVSALVGSSGLTGDEAPVALASADEDRGDEAVDDLAPSSDETANQMTEALTPICTGDATGLPDAPRPILDGSDTIVSIRLGDGSGQLIGIHHGTDLDLEPDSAVAPATAPIVECVTTADAGLVETCEPTPGAGSAETEGSTEVVTRRNLHWSVRLVEVRSGETLAERSGTATEPPPCSTIAQLRAERSAQVDVIPGDAVFAYPQLPTAEIDALRATLG